MRGRVGSHSTFIAVVALIATGLPANAQRSEGWSIYRGEGGLVAEFPAGIFTKMLALQRKVLADDLRATMAVITSPAIRSLTLTVSHLALLTQKPHPQSFDDYLSLGN